MPGSLPRPRPRRALRLLPAAALCAALLPASGCPTHPHFGKDEEGRGAILWKNRALGSSATPTPAAQGGAEKELLAEVRAAERRGGDDLALATALYNLAILRRQQGRFAEAEQLYRRALAIRERREGADDPDVAVVLNNLAALDAAQGRYDAARPLLQRALAIREKALGKTHVLTAESLNNLALLDAAQGDAAAAEPLYQRALAILEKADASQPGLLDRVLDNYAALLRDTGRDARAQQLEARARLIRAGGHAPANSVPAALR
jgi:tetratricopeptide (TPR) repeat protein